MSFVDLEAEESDDGVCLQPPYVIDLSLLISVQSGDENAQEEDKEEAKPDGFCSFLDHDDEESVIISLDACEEEEEEKTPKASGSGKRKASTSASLSLPLWLTANAADDVKPSCVS